MVSSDVVEALPRIDVSGLVSPELPARLAVARALDHAARSRGFFYVEGHGLPERLSTELLLAAVEFFRLPDSVKLRYYIGASTNHRGYVPPGEEVFYAGSKD